MLRTSSIAAWLLILLTIASTSLAQGRLEEAREAVRGVESAPSPTQQPVTKESHDGGESIWGSLLSGFFEGLFSDDEDDSPESSDDDESIGAFGLIALGAIAPVWLPHCLLHDDFSNTSYFPSYPYRYGEGYISDQSVKQRQWAGRAWLDHGDDFQGVDRTGAGPLLTTSARIGLDGAWNYYREEVAEDAFDSLSVGDFNLHWRFAQHPWAEFRLGAGVNWLHDQTDTDPGLNLSYAFDVYPLQPLVLSAEMDFGFLWEHSMFHGRLTAGVIVNRFEFFAGYDYLDIGRAALGHPLVGLRVWF